MLKKPLSRRQRLRLRLMLLRLKKLLKRKLPKMLLKHKPILWPIREKLFSEKKLIKMPPIKKKLLQRLLLSLTKI